MSTEAQVARCVDSDRLWRGPVACVMYMLPAWVVTVLLCGLACPALASASASAPVWSVRSVAVPSSFSTGDTSGCEPSHEKGCDSYVLTATNVGTGAAEGTIYIKDRLPAGVTEVGYHAAEHEPGNAEGTNGFHCSVESAPVTCEYENPVPVGGVMAVRVEVITEAAAAAAGSVTNEVEVEGGGATPTLSSPPTTAPNTVNTPPSVFGIEDFGADVLGFEGGSDVQAGDHPTTITTTLDYNSEINKVFSHVDAEYRAVAEPKSEIVDLPAGLVADPLAVQTCAASAVLETHKFPQKCPADSRVGIVSIEADGGSSVEVVDLFNVVPEAGYPAEFGFEFDEAVVMLRPRLLPSKNGYVLSVSVPYLPRSQTLKVMGARVTFFGDPSEQDHDGSGEAFLTNPADCTSGPLDAKLEMDSWVDPGDWQSAVTPMYEASASSEGVTGQGVTGCGRLLFDPSIEVSPETTEADTPSGYEVDVKVPQAPNVTGVLATPDLKDAVVSLPAGLSLSPAAAGGLVACQASGAEGIELGNHDPVDVENIAHEGEELDVDGLVHPAAGHCPAASQVGKVEVVTPLLAAPLKGHVFVAAPACGGAVQPACTTASAANGELFGLYLEVAGSGVIVKLRGTVSANPVTGRLTTTFAENPQLPFSELKLQLDGGQRAPLANPQSCGSVTATSDFTPWSTPATPDATPSSSFGIGGCPSTTPFAPTFSADSESAKAATYTPFTLTFSRRDGEQDLGGVQVVLPPGLVGRIAGVPECGEAEVRAAEAGSGGCPEGARLGSVTVSAGAGADPFWLSGSAYLTGPYDGAPYGLAVVIPVDAGPFDLGDEVVRATINIDPSTTAVTVTSNPLPLIKDGVPARLQTVNVTIDRPGFMLNPTNCEQRQITATIAGSDGGTAGVSSPFAVEGCKSLAFAPVLTASTQGHASKADGASLDVKVSYPAAGEANIRSVKTDLPLQLPTRLTTLQKACVAEVFEANPADCPMESVVGLAKASTPILSGPLMGPAYLVSHGNEKFPNLVIVLQGDGVRVDLVGDTDIKKGITSTTFNSIPDDPVSSFELYLPQGKYSILGAYVPAKANYDLCGQKLAMPTKITGQNGAVIKQTTMIEVTGCTTRKTKKKSTTKGKASNVGHGHGNARKS